MTTITDARNAIYNRWEDQWVVGTSARTEFVFENEAADELDAGTKPWARVTARESGEAPDTTMGQVGARKYYRHGVMFVQLFSPTNQDGMTTAGDLADAVRAAFEGVRFDGIDVLPGVIREAGPTGKWHLTVVEMPFRYEETK